MAVALNVGLVSSARADNSLALQMVPNVILSGSPGQYEIQYAQVVGGPQTNWAGLTTLFLTGGTTNYVDFSGAALSRRFYRAVNIPTNPNPARLAWITCGTFTMGSPSSEAERGGGETQHTVTLTNGFYMGKYAVTQGDYLAVVGSNPSVFTGDTNRPVETVSWNDATNYCALLTASEQAAGRLPSGWVYRLPTESEWEYACRAGTTSAFHYGNGLYHGMANFDTHYEYDSTVGTITTNTTGIGYLGRTTAVGSYAPNAFGLYDMHGNVWEWCRDWYGTYPSGSVTNPTGPASGSFRVLRGGGWGNRAGYCRSADRGGSDPAGTGSDPGFRVVLAPGQP